MASHFKTPENDGSASYGYSSQPSAYVPNGANPYLSATQTRRGGGSPKMPRRRHHVWPFVLLLVLAIIGVAAFSGYSLYKDAKQVMSQANSVVSSAGTLKDSLLSGDTAAVSQTTSDIAAKASAMHKTTEGPLWTAATYIPVYGEDVAQARQLTAMLDDMSQDAILPLGNALATTDMSSLISEDGRINVTAISTVMGALGNVSPAINTAQATLDGMGPSHIDKLTSAVNKARDLMDGLAPVAAKASTFATVLPTALGANGQTKTYLVLAQNNAEAHATGGLLGSTSLLTITDGKIELGEFASGWDLGNGGGAGAATITEEEAAIFGTHLNTHTTDCNLTPDFSRTGEILSQTVAAGSGQSIDGVVSVDPIVLQRLLGIVGGVDVNGKTLDGDNTASYLLHTVYNQLDPTLTDAFFGAAAPAAFNKVMSGLGGMSLTKLIDVVTKCVDDDRVYLWFADPTAQSAISEFPISGELGNDATAPELGVYVNDATTSKMSWYLSLDTTMGEPVQNADGTMTYFVTTTLANNISSQQASNDSKWITGFAPAKRDRSDMIDRVYLIAPAGGSISDVSVEGVIVGKDAWDAWPDVAYGDISATTLNQATLEGHDVWFGAVANVSQTSTTITYKVTCAAGADELTLRSTPTCQKVAGW